MLGFKDLNLNDVVAKRLVHFQMKWDWKSTWNLLSFPREKVLLETFQILLRAARLLPDHVVIFATFHSRPTPDNLTPNQLGWATRKVAGNSVRRHCFAFGTCRLFPCPVLPLPIHDWSSGPSRLDSNPSFAAPPVGVRILSEQLPRELNCGALSGTNALLPRGDVGSGLFE